MAIIQDFRARKGIISTENTNVSGNLIVSQQLLVTNVVSFSNTLSVTGNTTLTGNATMSGFANVIGSLQVGGIATFGAANATFDTNVLSIDATNNRVGVNTSLGQTVAFAVNGDANVAGTLNVTNFQYSGTFSGPNFTAGTSNTSFDGGTLFVDAVNGRVGVNNTTPDAQLTVTGAANVAGAFRVNGFTTLGSALTLGGDASLQANVVVTGNVTTSNTLAVLGAVNFSNTLSVVGDVNFNKDLQVTGTITATGGISGTIAGVADQCARSVTAGAGLIGGGALTVDRTLSVDSTPNNTANKIVQRDASGNFSANQITATQFIGPSTQTNALLFEGGYRSASQYNNGNTIMARDSSGSFYASYMYGTATSALYADLAELYLADQKYVVGTVVKIGGEFEITQSTALDYVRPLGVISEKPAYLMNSSLENGVAVALKGRVPVRVVGLIKKGQGLGISALPGVATMSAINYFAIAMEDYDSYNEGVIEAVVI